MEYYLYRNGKAFSATVHDSLAGAKEQLQASMWSHPTDVWFMEDEDGIEVRL